MTIRAMDRIFGVGAKPHWRNSCAPNRPTGWLFRKFCPASAAICKRCCPTTAVMGFPATVRAKMSSVAGLCATHGGLRKRVLSGCQKRRTVPRWDGMRCCPGWFPWCGWQMGVSAVGPLMFIWIIMVLRHAARACSRWPHWSGRGNRRCWWVTLIRSRSWRGG